MSDLQPGTLIDNRYLVEAEIGRGGMAAVYRVRHAQLGTLAALKVLTLPATSIQQRLMHEGRVQAALQHPNIVAVSDVVIHDGAPGLVMEYVRGPSLDDFLMRRRLSLDQADEIARGILRGVGAAHDHGLIHRDLKPANIMLAITSDGLVPKVTDFGLVKMILGEGDGMSRTRSGVAMGTPSYMAPEQISDAKKVDKRADIFSLGAILYELLSNQRAFDGDDMFKIFSAIVGGTYQPIRELLPDLPERMENAVNGALEPDREQRIESCESLLAVWMGHVGSDGSISDASRGPWDADLLAEVSDMGAGGESTAESLRRSFKGSLPISMPVRDTEAQSAPTIFPTAGDTVAPHPDDVEDEDDDDTVPGASTSKTQSTMAPMPGMFDEPMPQSVQKPHPGAPVAAPVGEPPTPSSALPKVAAAGAVIFMLGLGIVGLGAWGSGMFGNSPTTTTVPKPTPDPLPDPVPTVPDPAPEPQPDPVPSTPDPEPAPTPQPAVPDPAPVPEPVVPDPAPAEPDPVPAPDPEPVSEPAAPAKPEVWIDSGGVTVTLRKQNGRPADLDNLTAGTYQLVAFFTTPTEPYEQGEITVKDGEIWQVTCIPNLRRCKIKQRD